MTRAIPWPEVERLFDLAVAREPGDRAAFLDQACDDPALRCEVESLLFADEQASGFLEVPLVPARHDPRIGPYRLLRKLGEGETSTVYLAARDDDQYHQRVAIKVIRPGMGSRQILQRFHQERQILASLSHAHIARLFDGGCTPAGQPYFVMEYVDGEPLDVHCDHHGLSPVRRLELFRLVCLAVHFAHRKAVVHRDLKPSNILVDAEGTPRLVDFGIAKLLDPERMGIQIEATATAARLMTPHYASPEQVQGKPIGAASDVYSLGVILYKLLTGQRPYELSSPSLHAIERVVCETMPPPPSRVVRGRRAERLPHDVDNIVLMAMRKEPERRYASAQALADDVRRCLERRPVRARRDTLGYRISSFLRRNAGGVAVALLVLSLVIGAAAITWEWRQAVAERSRAESRRRTPEPRLGFVIPQARSLGARAAIDEAGADLDDESPPSPGARAARVRTRGATRAGDDALAAQHAGSLDEAACDAGEPCSSERTDGRLSNPWGRIAYTCRDLATTNACGEPQAGVPDQIVCDTYNNLVRCTRGASDGLGFGHWELVRVGDCLQSQSRSCAPPPTSDHACEGGVDFCGAPVAGAPNQISCGRDGVRNQCTKNGWQRRSDLGPCTQVCPSEAPPETPPGPPEPPEPSIGPPEPPPATPVAPPTRPPVTPPTNPPSGPPITPIGDGLPAPVATWRFDVACDTGAVTDVSGNGADGAKINVGCARDGSASAGSFDGGARVDVPDRPAFHFATAMTMAAWVKPSQLAGPQTLFNKWYGPDSYMLLLQDGNYYFGILLSDGTPLDIYMPAVANRWAHVVGVFDGISMAVYVDGYQASRPARGTLTDSARPIEMGSHPIWNGYSGLIYEARLYNVALTSAQVQVLRQTSGPFGRPAH